MKPYYEDEKAGITIYHADCREVLPHLPRVDVVLTDPQYGLAGADTSKNAYGVFIDTPENVTPLVMFVLDFYGRGQNGTRIVLTPGQKQMFSYAVPKAVGAFYYPAGSGSCSWGFVGWQPIFFYGNDPYLATGKGRVMNSYASIESAEAFGHPCAKPIKQWAWLMNRCSFEGETILDPFMGSGTT